MLRKSFIVVMFVFVLSAVVTAAEITIFFYNPDAAPTDPSILIKTSSDYFKKAGVQIKIQPVIDADVFAKLVKENKAKVFIASSGLLKSLGAGFKEILIPNSEDGTPTYKKIVMVKEDFKSVADLKGQNVGSTSLGPESLNFLNEYVFKPSEYDLSNSKVIYVKKDIDALLAAKIGQIKAAVISEKNLSKIEKINPAAVAGIKKLLTSGNIPESPLCAANDVPAGDIDTLTKAFTDMHNTPEGKEFLKILGYSKWVTK
ncbi:PhnD/SsuA/transferrin family substrate-binding protein [Candidatus Dependentiae bacterium]|nr:PhnD/SsuA/transferrin family substrate-binding protein [Candidatus Dependentiae bacterium]